MMESFCKTQKYEEVNLCECEIFQELVNQLPCFLENVYGQTELHSTLDYLPLDKFENELLNQKK
jgi:putative transposase